MAAGVLVSGPIRPDQVVEKKTAQIPEFVFDAFNECIAKNRTGSSAQFTQDEVVSEILTRMPLHRDWGTRQEIYNNHWLDVEEAYRAVGWTVDRTVVYDKPGFCETDSANFTFSNQRRR